MQLSIFEFSYHDHKDNWYYHHKDDWMEWYLVKYTTENRVVLEKKDYQKKKKKKELWKSENFWDSLI